MSPAGTRAPRSERPDHARRFGRRRWAGRWARWRVWVALVLLLALAGAAVWAVFFSSLLAVARVDVEGERVLSDAQVRTAAAVPEGRPLALVDLDDAQRRVEALAAVQEAAVTRAWPDGVLITVTEREAVAVIERGDLWEGVDVEGVAFRTFDELPGSLPLVEVGEGADRETVREVAGVAAALPERIARDVRVIEAASVDEIVLRLRDDRTVVWGSADDSPAKGEVLAVLMRQEGSRYDVSVPGRPAVLP